MGCQRMVVVWLIVVAFVLVSWGIYRYSHREKPNAEIKPRSFDLDCNISEEEELLLEDEQDAQDVMDLLFLDEEE